MQIELTDDQEFFRDTTRQFLEAEAPISVVRDLWTSRDGFSRDWWREAAGLGWTLFFVPEEHGGVRLSGEPLADAAIVAEERGRMVAPGPFLPVNVVASALADEGTPEQQAAVFPGLLSGEQVATWAFGEPGSVWSAQDFEVTVSTDGPDVVIDGTKAYVEAAAVADSYLVTGATKGGLTQVLVPADAHGVAVNPGRSIDLVQRYGSVHFDQVRLPQSTVVGRVGAAADAVERQLERALVLQCAETVGAADRAFELTVEYSQDRYAFGRPIGSFQALKHRFADMLQWLEFSKAIADGAVRAVGNSDRDAEELVSIAKAYVATHCLDVIDDCVQISGGIGVTWEHDVHLYLRRATVNHAVNGTPEFHKQRLAALLQAGEP